MRLGRTRPEPPLRVAFRLAKDTDLDRSAPEFARGRGRGHAMPELSGHPGSIASRNTGVVVGQKRALRPGHAWSIHMRLAMGGSGRDRAPSVITWVAVEISVKEVFASRSGAPGGSKSHCRR
jgi:hypothetical protein